MLSSQFAALREARKLPPPFTLHKFVGFHSAFSLVQTSSRAWSSLPTRQAALPYLDSSPPSQLYPLNQAPDPTAARGCPRCAARTDSSSPSYPCSRRYEPTETHRRSASARSARNCRWKLCSDRRKGRAPHCVERSSDVGRIKTRERGSRKNFIPGRRDLRWVLSGSRATTLSLKATGLLASASPR
eukprot:scaffold6052_cov154-Pinguiococcus_pyrenoidosus.AAC.1